MKGFFTDKFLLATDLSKYGCIREDHHVNYLCRSYHTLTVASSGPPLVALLEMGWWS